MSRYRRRHPPPRPRRRSSAPIVFNVIILTALLVGILLFKRYAADRAASFIDEFGPPGTGSGASASLEQVERAASVAGNMVGLALEAATEEARRLPGEQGEPAP